MSHRSRGRRGRGNEDGAEQRHRARAEQFHFANEGVNNWANGRSHLEMVQEMCKNLLGLREDEFPVNITRCKQLLRSTYINLYDYVRGRYDMQYGSARELIQRSKQLRRERGYGFYSVENAKTEGRKHLLRGLFGSR
jgi:hypothetical protein